MMNETKERTRHTPTPLDRIEKYPYKISQSTADEMDEAEQRINIGDDAYDEIRFVFAKNPDEIVRAVNAHDELVAALKQMKIAMKNFLTLEGGIEKSAMEAADKALAKAEGR